MQPTLVRRADPEANEEWFLLQVGEQTVGYIDLVDRGDEMWVAEIAVHPAYRGQGLATRLLTTALAYHHGSDFALACEPFEAELREWPRRPGLPGDALAAWYARHGFQRDPARDPDISHHMVRPSRGQPNTDQPNPEDNRNQ